MRMLLLTVLSAGSVLAQDPLTERQLATIPADLSLESSPITAPDGSKEINRAQFAFGAGGRFVAYIAYRGAKGVAVAGDKILGEYHYLHAPVMDAAGEHFAFRAGNRIKPDKEQWWAIVDGEPGKPFAWIGEVGIGLGGVAAFWEQPGAKVEADGAYNESPMVFHFGAKVTKKFDSAASLVAPSFSADGKLVATCGVKGGQHLPFVFDQKKELSGKGYAAVEDVVCSPNGKRIAAVVVVDGAPLPPGEPAPPGMERGKWRIAVDGKLHGDAGDDVGAPEFSPDSKRLAFKVVRGAKMGIGTDEGKAACDHDFVGMPVFDPSGENLLFVGRTGGTDRAGLMRWEDPTASGGKCALCKLGRRGKSEVLIGDAEHIRHPTFGPGARTACAVRRGDKWHIVAGPTESVAYDEVGPPVFAASGECVAFGARIGRELWWKVLPVK